MKKEQQQLNETTRLGDTKLKGFPYRDIIDLPHHQSKKRDHMSMEGRAGQFMPFAALTGFDDVVEETARLTDSKKTLSADQQEKIDEALKLCMQRQGEEPELEIEYFIPDLLKNGGEYVKTTEKLLRVETQNRKIVLKSGKKISIDDIYDIKIAWK